MKAKHTPGPWRHNGLERSKPHVHDEQKAVAVWAGETPVALCKWDVGRYGPVDDETADANARLIAAAPDLLVILKRILYAHDTGNCGASMGEAILCRSYAEHARAAIAKAEGN